MKNVETVSGRIGIIERRPSSKNGNPRYKISIGNGDSAGAHGSTGENYRCVIAFTTPDSSLAYAIGNKGLREGDMVEARVGMHYGVLSIDSMEPATDKGGE